MKKFSDIMISEGVSNGNKMPIIKEYTEGIEKINKERDNFDEKYHSKFISLINKIFDAYLKETGRDSIDFSEIFKSDPEMCPWILNINIGKMMSQDYNDNILIFGDELNSEGYSSEVRRSLDTFDTEEICDFLDELIDIPEITKHYNMRFVRSINK